MADDPRTTDADLLALAREDAHAFRRFYDRHAAAILGWFRSRGVDHHTALDMTAETFAESWRSRDRFEDRGDGNAGPWLFGIARHVLSHAARHRAVATAARERLGMLADPRPLDGDALAAIEHIDGLAPQLDRALGELAPPSRRAVDLRVVQGRSYAEIGNELGCTPLAARIRVSRAIAHLRNDLTHDITDERGAPT